MNFDFASRSIFKSHNTSQITLCVTCCRWSHPQQSYGSPGAGAGWAGYSGHYALHHQQQHYSPQHHCYPASYQHQHQHPPASSEASSSASSSGRTPQPQQGEHQQQGPQWGPQLSPGHGDRKKVRILSGFQNIWFSKQGEGVCVGESILSVNGVLVS